MKRVAQKQSKILRRLSFFIGFSTFIRHRSLQFLYILYIYTYIYIALIFQMIFKVNYLGVTMCYERFLVLCQTMIMNWQLHDMAILSLLWEWLRQVTNENAIDKVAADITLLLLLLPGNLQRQFQRESFTRIRSFSFREH